ncbi:MAG: rhombosortase [Deltaproteobacteria bacterium]|nr:MAG: rhombosortase [Deltaproteobacteria bacterium]
MEMVTPADAPIRIHHRAAGRFPYASLLLTLLAVIVHLSHGLRVDLLYDRLALSRVELWRIATCHWVHLSWDHLFWSGATFLCLGAVCERLDKKKTYLTITVSVFLIPVALWWGLPGLEIYGGLSGLDCALYALLFTLLGQREAISGNRRWTAVFRSGLLALLAKVAYETVTGQTIFVSSHHAGMVPVPLSHLVGGMVGFSVGICKEKSRHLP